MKLRLERSRSPALLLELALLAAPVKAPKPPPLPSCEVGVRHIELRADTPGKPPELCIHRGLTTTLRSDSKMAKVELEGREKFSDVLVGKSSLMLVPSEALLVGERVRLRITFQDGAAPLIASFDLVMHPIQADRQVEVFRHPRPLASYRQAEQQAQAEARQCREENARLLAECRGLGGFTEVIAKKLMSKGFIAGKRVTEHFIRNPLDLLVVHNVYSYRFITDRTQDGRVIARLVLELYLTNQGELPWMPAGAALVGPTGEEREAMSVWTSEPLPRGEVRPVVVELEMTELEARGSFTLLLWDASGLRRVEIGGVTFP
ncbi:MAG TPA: DUF2381 family protein [Myxococcaceae bacterium]|nr:DUF2381 family protein [Myxococcaceae bacterium]